MSQQQERGLFLQGEDLGRALVFSSFWGSIFYLLAFVSQLLAFRRPPAEVQSKPTLTGAGIFVGGFVGLGTLGIAIVSLLKGKSPAEQAREQLGTAGEGGSNSVFGTALGAGLGSVVPFSFAVGSMRLAERIAGIPAVGPQEHVDLPRAAAVNALLTALIAAAVTRITGWVARDARAAERTRM